MSNRLTLSGLSKRFGGLHVFGDVQFDVPAGQITALIGPNGAGKTTLINIICGVLRADTGQILKDGRLLEGYGPARAVKLGLARTFQDVRLFPTLSVLENVLVAFPRQPGDRLARLAGRRWRAAEQENRERALKLLQRLELASATARPASELPFGSQKLAGLARAVATGAETLLLDEPTTGLEVSRIPLVTQFLTELRSQGHTILLVEHNVEVVAGLADQVVVLQGSVITSGPPAQVLQDERVIREYLGRLYDA